MMQIEYPIEPTENMVGDSIGRWHVSIFMKLDSEVTNLPNLTETIPDRSSGKPCQRRCRANASEHIYGFSMGCMLTVHS